MPVQEQAQVLSGDAHAHAHRREALQVRQLSCHLRQPLQPEQTQAHAPGEAVQGNVTAL